MNLKKDTQRTLKSSNLAKKYKSRWVVKDVSIKVNTGQIVGLLGPNGAGKTTAFYMLVGLVGVNKGKVELDGNDITTLPMHLRARAGIGYLPQEASIFRKLSVEGNIMSILETRSDLSKGKKYEVMEDLLQEFNIQHIRESLGIALSGGERRRTEIARALAASPQFILLDEPFAGVDPISVIDIKKIIIHLKNRGIGVLITDHNVRETLDVCEHAYIMNAGSVIAEGNSDYILDNQEVRRVYLGEQFRL